MNKIKYFDFGENWSNYLHDVDDDRVSLAMKNINDALGDNFIRDKSFLDIGCGSGIHSLAALKLNAKYVKSFDINKKNIINTKKIISKFWEKNNYDVEVMNILEANDYSIKYDIVYSWGVLHHTGEMNIAIKNSINYCKKNSILFIALYEKTIYCKMWRMIKKFYNNTNRINQFLLLNFYNILKIFGLLITLKNPYLYVKNYRSNRGMSFIYDQIDWIGGYPYESINKTELLKIIGSDFKLLQYKRAKTGLFRSILGTGCSEYVFKKKFD